MHNLIYILIFMTCVQYLFGFVGFFVKDELHVLRMSVLSVAWPKFVSKNIYTHTHTHTHRLRVVALVRLVCVSSSRDPLVINPHLGDDPNQLISIFLESRAAASCSIIEIDGIVPSHFFFLLFFFHF